MSEPIAATGAAAFDVGINYLANKNAAKLQREAMDRQTNMNIVGQQQSINTLRDAQSAAQNIYQQGAGQAFDTLSQIPEAARGIYDPAFTRMQGLSQQKVQDLQNRIGAGADVVSGTLGSGYGAARDIYSQYDPTMVTGEAREDIMAQGQPYTGTGQQALDMYAQAAMDPYSSPLFQRKLEQGQEALNQQLAARGLMNSGAAIQAQSDLYQDLAAKEQALAENRLGNLAQMGQQQTLTQQQLAAQLYGQEAGLGSQYAAAQAGLETDLATQQAYVAQREAMMGQQVAADFYDELGRQTGAQADVMAGYQTQAARDQAQIQADMARTLAGMESGTGSDIANIWLTSMGNMGAIQGRGTEALAESRLAEGRVLSDLNKDVAEIWGAGYGEKSGGGGGRWF